MFHRVHWSRSRYVSTGTPLKSIVQRWFSTLLLSDSLELFSKLSRENKPIIMILQLWNLVELSSLRHILFIFRVFHT